MTTVFHTTRFNPTRAILWCYPTASRNISSDLHPWKLRHLYENGESEALRLERYDFCISSVTDMADSSLGRLGVGGSISEHEHVLRMALLRMELGGAQSTSRTPSWKWGPRARLRSKISASTDAVRFCWLKARRAVRGLLVPPSAAGA
jgi:hypothetical protein